MPPRKPKLRAVAPDETATRDAPKTILQAAEDGSRLEELQAMRRRIARALDDPNTAARDLAALSRRQLEISKEIEAIQIAEDEDHSVIANTDDEDWDESAI
ncbi:hypothetical protein [Nocardia otitidiscaviarum]|uniref:hypothetical protein n=1 Tax=Nocardia otitidiscaviarum TaxID=1823 RepID=UPI0006947C7F|nr:hypothetical protein [Nocardia otitidiscaviarum]